MKPPPFLRRFARSLVSDRRTLGRDAIAGIPGAIGSVPDGMASSVLVGVSPFHGLYASFAGPIAGGLTASTRRMVVTTTTAASLAAGSTLGHVDPAKRGDSLILLTLLAGAIMLAAGILRLGRFTRFVSISVMLGFLSGVAVNVLFGQIPDLTGAPSHGRFALAKAWNVLTHPARIHWASLLVGLLALALMVGLARTRVAPVASLVAIIVPTALTFWLDGVAKVEDAGSIPTGVPLPHLPTLSVVSLNLITGAAAVAIIVLVQGVGVSESAPNPDGARAKPNRDFIAQGVGNLASALFRGQPVGGSVSQTALNIAAGARDRWASIFSGLWMLAILLVFSGIVGKVALPTLAAILMYAAATSLRTGELQAVWRTGHNSQIALATTFLCTLFLPVSAAVGVGVALSLLLQLNRDALDLAVVQLVPQPDGRLVEQPPPQHLESRTIIALDVYGSLFYAGAKTLEVRLPDPADAEAAVVVLRLRGRTSLGATGLAVLARYGDRLAAGGGRLFLSGVDPALVEQLRRSGRVDDAGPVQIVEATEVIGESTGRAYAEAEEWLVSRETPSPPAR
jgi:SulP family sulfate permease